MSLATATAQDALEGTGRVKDLEVTRNRALGTITVDFSLDISDLKVGSDETLILTPVIKNGDMVEKLPAVEIMGRRATIYNQRNDILSATELPFLAQRIAKRAERKNGLKQSVDYTATTRFQEWMRGGEVTVQRGSCGCDPDVVNLGDQQVGGIGNEIYQPSYVVSYLEPEPEPVKVRDESRSAYINFWVDKWDIRENYMDNKRELASVIESIELVKEDEDLTITSITIEGWASPESPEKHNQMLSDNRAESLAKYMTKHTGIARDMISTVGYGENWPGLKAYVEGNKELDNREAILDIIDDESLSLDDKNNTIAMRFTPTYYYLLKEVYPSLRRNDYRIIYKVRNFDMEEARSLLESNPKKLSVNEIYKVAGSYERGSAEYNRALEVAALTYPEDVAAAVNYAQKQVEKGDMEGALETLNKSKQESAEVQAVKGYVYLQMQEYNKAREALTKAIDLGSEDAKHNLEEMEKHLASI